MRDQPAQPHWLDLTSAADVLDLVASREPNNMTKRRACLVTARYLAALADGARNDLSRVDPLPEYHYDNEGHAIHDA